MSFMNGLGLIGLDAIHSTMIHKEILMGQPWMLRPY